MKTLQRRPDPCFIAGILLVFPTFYFFLASFLHYELGIPFLWNLIGPYFERPENKSLGLNANLLIAFGPLIAILINLPALVRIRLIYKEDLPLSLSVLLRLDSIRWLVIFGGLAAMGMLFVYLLGENCRCF